MKYLWLSLFCTLAVLSINAQDFNGTWLGDWQNACLLSCQPESVVITSFNSTAYNISLTFASSNLQYCSNAPFSVTGNYNDTLNNVGGVWTDSKGSIVSITTTNGTNGTNGTTILNYQFGGSPNPVLLYTSTGAIFNKQDSLGAIGGVWANPFNVSNTSNSSVCCVPDSMYLTLADSQNRLNAVFSFGSSNCSTNSTVNGGFAIIHPTASSLVWSPTLNSNYSLVFNPSASLSGSVLTWGPNATCQYGYLRSNETILNTTWQKDWQSSPGANFVNLTTYQITAVTSLNTTYMISNSTNNGTVSNSFVVQTPSGAFYDAFLNAGSGVTFSFNQPTDTLLDSPDNLLLSTNGSLLSNTPYIGNWSTPIALTNTSLPEGCCVPTQVNISANGATQSPLNVMYQLPSNWDEVYGCRDLASAIDSSNVITSTLVRTGPPSLTQLTWMDSSFNSTMVSMNGSQITIQNMTLGCGFSMSIGGAPGPNPPGPLSASIVSTGIISLIMGLFMLAF